MSSYTLARYFCSSSDNWDLESLLYVYVCMYFFLYACIRGSMILLMYAFSLIYFVKDAPLMNGDRCHFSFFYAFGRLCTHAFLSFLK